MGRLEGFREGRRKVLVGLGAAATTSLFPDAFAQSRPYDRINTISARGEFDIPGGMFDLFEYGPASKRLRSIGASIEILFKMVETHVDERWAPLIGFSIGDESGDRLLQLDFADMPKYENLVISADMLDYRHKPRQSTELAHALAPVFKRRDVHKVQIRFESESVMAIFIGNKRRPFPINFPPHRLIVRASGVKGWVEFVEPGVG